MTVTEFQTMMKKIEKITDQYGLQVEFAYNGGDNDSRVEIFLDKRDEENDT